MTTLTTSALADHADILDRLHTSQVADTLDRMGLRSQVLDRAVAPIAPGARAIGPAAAVQFVATDSYPLEDPYGDFIRYLDDVPTGSVAVVATDAPEASALWGELFSAAALGRGVQGMVTDGCTRDSEQIRALGFPAFSRGQRPIDYRGRQRIVASFGSVDCGGVTIVTGDLIVADDDGVVCVPADAIAECLAIAADRVRGENTVLAELLGGATLQQVWDRHGLL